MVKVISRSQAETKIENSRGRFFSVTFTKRTDGKIRHMTARTGVHSSKYSPLTGKGLGYNPKSKNLVNVYEMKTHEYRNINLLGLSNLKINGVPYEVVQPDTVLGRVIEQHVEKARTNKGKNRPTNTTYDLNDAYGDSYKNPAYMEKMIDLADMERTRNRDEAHYD